ncbi:unnamed protein product, partial [Staurois parvus]
DLSPVSKAEKYKAACLPSKTQRSTQCKTQHTVNPLIASDINPFLPSVISTVSGGLTTPGAIGDHGAPVSLPKLKKAYEKGTRGISWGPY